MGLRFPKPYIFNIARGFRGKQSRILTHARKAIELALTRAMLFRRRIKFYMPALWRARIRAACQEYGLTYNQFYEGLKQQNIRINRLMLQQLAQQEPYSFKALCDQVHHMRGRAQPHGTFAS